METLDIITIGIAVLGIIAAFYLISAILRVAKEYKRFISLLGTLMESGQAMREFAEKLPKQVDDCISSLGDDLHKYVDEELDKRLKKPVSNTECGSYTKFDAPGEIFEGDTIHVHQMLPDGHMLCQILTHDRQGDTTHTINAYIRLKDSDKFKYYDGQDITLPRSAVVFQTGTFQYSGGMFGTPITVPAIEIFGLDKKGNEGKDKV